MYLPAIEARCLPTGTEPVNEILRMIGDGIRYSEILAGTPNTRLTTPAGTPASWNAWTRPMHAEGVSSGPLRMIEQPAARAAATLRTAWFIGKFHGVNAATGPIGSRLANCRM